MMIQVQIRTFFRVFFVFIFKLLKFTVCFDRNFFIFNYKVHSWVTFDKMIHLLSGSHGNKLIFSVIFVAKNY